MLPPPLINKQQDVRKHRMLQKNENLQAELDSAFGGVGSYDVSNSGKTKAICILKNYCIIEEAPKPRRLHSPRNLDFADDANRLRLRPRVPSATATWRSATGLPAATAARKGRLPAARGGRLPAATAGGIRGPRGAAAGGGQVPGRAGNGGGRLEHGAAAGGGQRGGAPHPRRPADIALGNDNKKMWLDGNRNRDVHEQKTVLTGSPFRSENTPTKVNNKDSNK
ncbi:circumsporozoite protein-like isoform X2 [Panicum virgatum]|uniref:circumsporozoite protein-like isoform X2 n=1 Tax=Panicum virgatum TaxID=38727 RepID=UPI0019D52EC8|nr:circumsporozoite protein-like isoform X2 [Panicum virgatum]